MLSFSSFVVTCLGAETNSVATLQTCEAVMLILLKNTNLLGKQKMHRQLCFLAAAGRGNRHLSCRLHQQKGLLSVHCTSLELQSEIVSLGASVMIYTVKMLFRI